MPNTYILTIPYLCLLLFSFPVSLFIYLYWLTTTSPNYYQRVRSVNNTESACEPLKPNFKGKLFTNSLHSLKNFNLSTHGALQASTIRFSNIETDICFQKCINNVDTILAYFRDLFMVFSILKKCLQTHHYLKLLDFMHCGCIELCQGGLLPSC